MQACHGLKPPQISRRVTERPAGSGQKPPGIARPPACAPSSLHAREGRRNQPERKPKHPANKGVEEEASSVWGREKQIDEPRDTVQRMANAVVPRLQGDNFQTRWFWYRAAGMYLNENIHAVGYEVEDVRSFDDVVVYFAEPNSEGSLQDFYQIKFRVTAGAPFTHMSLAEPGFINATAVSILQRLRDAQRIHAPDGIGARFYLVTPTDIDPEDPLRNLISQAEGAIRWDRLSQGGPRSRMGKVREAWKKNLGLDSDEELQRVLMPFRIRERAPMLADLRKHASDRLRLAGWRPYEDGLASLYDDLPGKLVQHERTVFTADELREIGRQEGLWLSPPLGLRPPTRTVGIRSFTGGTESMSEEVDELLCLLEHFDDRWPIDDHGWRGAIIPRVREFLRTLPQDQPVHLTVRAHNTIAFAAGYTLHSKAGVEVYPVQVGGAHQIWQPLARAHDGTEVWAVEKIGVGEGADIALAIGVTHEIMDEVVRFARQDLNHVGRVVGLRVHPAPGPSAIRDGTHANQLAQSAVALTKAAKDGQRGAVVHVFAAAPAGFMFFLGQNAHALGRCRLYEHDFSETQPLPYESSADFLPEFE